MRIVGLCAGSARIALQLSIGSSARVLVAECDSICALQECLEGVRVALAFAKMVVIPAIGLSHSKSSPGGELPILSA